MLAHYHNAKAIIQSMSIPEDSKLICLCMNGQEPKMVIIVVMYIYLVLHTHVFISTYPDNDFYLNLIQ